MAIRPDTGRPSERVPAAPRRIPLGETVVLVALAAMVTILGWVYFFKLSAREGAARPHAFNFKNPMLDARAGECVEMQSADASQSWCIAVLENGLVTRPRAGPVSWGAEAGLRSELPYLACQARVPAPGTGGCAGRAFVGQPDVLLYDLNGFGILKPNTPRLDTIQGKWARIDGRDKFVYEVALERYGQDAGTWVMLVSDDAPVAGLVTARAAVGQGNPQVTFFRDAGDCPPN